MPKYDVYVRESVIADETYVVRVEGSPSAESNKSNYLMFCVDGDRDPTALFPHQNISKVVRVADED